MEKDKILNLQIKKLLSENIYAKYFIAENQLIEKKYLIGEYHKNRITLQCLKEYSLLKHKNISQLLNVCEDEQKYFRIQEFQSNISLKDLINNKTEISLVNILKIIEQICYAMISSKSKGIDFCGLSPDTIFVDDDYNVQLIDFGSDKYGMSEINQYTSPEELQNEKRVTQSDIYKFGIILYNLVTKSNLLNDSRNNKEDILNIKIPDLSNEYFEIGNLLKRMTQKIIDKRYPDFEMCVLDLFNLVSFRTSYYGRNYHSRKSFVESDTPLLNIQYVVVCKNCQNEISLSLSDIYNNYIECHICEEINSIAKEGLKYIAICEECNNENVIGKNEIQNKTFICENCNYENTLTEIEFEEEIENITAICNECGSEIEPDEDEKKKKKFVCPECNAENLL